jgi:hypothetical protein
VDDVPVFHHRTILFVLAVSGMAATTILTIGLIKLWGYQHPDSKIAHGFTTIVG